MTRRLDINNEIICKLYKNKKSAKEIGKILNCSDVCVLYRLKECGITSRTNKESHEYQQKLTDNNIEEICKKYKNGQSSNHIAKQYNVSPTLILKTLKKTNIIIRNRYKSIKLMNYPYSEERKEKLRKRMLNGGALKALKGNNRYNTKPNKIFKKILDDNKIGYKQEFIIQNKSYDFFIQPNILIEIDGDYWHANPSKYKKLNITQKANKINDKIKNKIAKNNGYILLRIWESELKNNMR